MHVHTHSTVPAQTFRTCARSRRLCPVHQGQFCSSRGTASRRVGIFGLKASRTVFLLASDRTESIKRRLDPSTHTHIENGLNSCKMKGAKPFQNIMDSQLCTSRKRGHQPRYTLACPPSNSPHRRGVLRGAYIHMWCCRVYRLLLSTFLRFKALEMNVLCLVLSLNVPATVHRTRRTSTTKFCFYSKHLSGAIFCHTASVLGIPIFPNPPFFTVRKACRHAWGLRHERHGRTLLGGSWIRGRGEYG